MRKLRYTILTLEILVSILSMPIFGATVISTILYLINKPGKEVIDNLVLLILYSLSALIVIFYIIVKLSIKFLVKKNIIEGKHDLVPDEIEEKVINRNKYISRILK